MLHGALKHSTLIFNDAESNDDRSMLSMTDRIELVNTKTLQVNNYCDHDLILKCDEL